LWAERKNRALKGVKPMGPLGALKRVRDSESTQFLRGTSLTAKKQHTRIRRKKKGK